MDVKGMRCWSSDESTTTDHQYDQSIQHHHHHQEILEGESLDDQEMLNMELRRGPWTVEEDLLLINYISNHGEGRWNSLAQSAGLKRTGKSCRLRWLNYLRPDVRRGNITPEEQLLILELHSRWGNRWSKIAQYLPGRTDNEIKNYWRTRVQKQAKQLKCDVNSKLFKDTMRYIWMPRLAERIRAAEGASSGSTAIPENNLNNNTDFTSGQQLVLPVNMPSYTTTPDNSSISSDSFGTTSTTTNTPQDYGNYHFQKGNMGMEIISTQNTHIQYTDSLTSPSGYFNQQGGLEVQGGGGSQSMNGWFGGEDGWENLWNPEDIWFLQQQL